MKRFVAISLAVIYFSISSGIVINVHYCMGRVADIAFGDNESDKCPKCGMENKGCCHDDVKVVKLQDSHQLFNNHVEIAKAEALIPEYSSVFNWQIASNDTDPVQRNHSPPLTGDIPLSILNCVFRI